MFFGGADFGTSGGSHLGRLRGFISEAGFELGGPIFGYQFGEQIWFPKLEPVNKIINEGF